MLQKCVSLVGGEVAEKTLSDFHTVRMEQARRLSEHLYFLIRQERERAGRGRKGGTGSIFIM